jgi:hypothetical protein
LLRETLALMPNSLIEETLKSDNKNIDYKNLARLFDKNDNADPELIVKML